MSLSELATAIFNLRFLIKEQQDCLCAQGLNAEAMLALADNYRRLGCGLLLIDLDPPAFANNLYLSGVVYREMLRHRSAPTLDPYYLTASFGWPLLDAIAAGAEKLTSDIAREMPTVLRAEQGEDEEDFCYFQLLMALASAPPDPTIASSQLEAFAEACDGKGSQRSEVLGAILKRDSQAFDESFESLSRDWQAGILAKRKAGRLNPYDVLTTANIFVEGLAILRMAKRAGLETHSEYPWIPEPVLLLVHTAFPDDSAALGQT
jgi:hypothetical protein